MKYKVLIGTHVENRRRYNKGDVIETERPLTTKFPGKFEKVFEEPTSIPTAPAAPAH